MAARAALIRGSHTLKTILPAIASILKSTPRFFTTHRTDLLVIASWVTNILQVGLSSLMSQRVQIASMQGSPRVTCSYVATLPSQIYYVMTLWLSTLVLLRAGLALCAQADTSSASSELLAEPDIAASWEWLSQAAWAAAYAAAALLLLACCQRALARWSGHQPRSMELTGKAALKVRPMPVTTVHMPGTIADPFSNTRQI